MKITSKIIRKKSQSNVKHRTSKNATDFILCLPSPAGLGSLKSGLPSQGGSIGETNFSVAIGYKLEIASGLGMWICVHFPSQSWDFIRPRPVHALSISPWFLGVHICLSPAAFRRPCFHGELHLLWLLQTFFLLFCRVPQSLSRKS